MCDQLRADSLGAAGHPLVRTPNIDRLAASGVQFTRAYTESPVCVPARINALTGLHSWQVGVFDNGPSPAHTVPTLGTLLTEQGYFTQAVGKMHFRPPRNHVGFQRMWLSEEIPTYRDDDEFLQYLREQGYGHVGEPHGQRHELYYQPQVSVLPEEHHTTAWTADRTVDFIARNRNRPFFCFTSFIKPHPPWDPPHPYATLYDPATVPMPVRRASEREPVDTHLLVQNHGKGVDDPDDDLIRLIRARYYGLISHIDRNVGKIINALDEYGLTERTLIVFISDHGELLGEHYAWGKRSFYEGSARVPFLVSWPGRLPAGETREHFVSGCDLLPTFLAAAGAADAVPADVTGQNLLPLCADAATSGREALVGQFASDRLMKLMLRWDDWKYCYFANGGRQQLFNLRDDPHELEDRAGQHPALCSRARERLEWYFRAAGHRGALDDAGNALRSYPFAWLPLGRINRQHAIWPHNEPGVAAVGKEPGAAVTARSRPPILVVSAQAGLQRECAGCCPGRWLQKAAIDYSDCSRRSWARRRLFSASKTERTAATRASAASRWAIASAKSGR